MSQVSIPKTILAMKAASSSDLTDSYAGMILRGGNAEVTTGRMLVRRPIEDNGGPVHVPPGLLAKAEKLGSPNGNVTFTNGGDKVTAECSGDIASDDCPGRNWPDTDGIVRDATSRDHCVKLLINPALLLAAAKALGWSDKRGASESVKTVELTIPKPEIAQGREVVISPIVVRLVSDPEGGLALVMPAQPPRR